MLSEEKYNNILENLYLTSDKKTMIGCWNLRSNT